jgi:hypothetical protein
MTRVAVVTVLSWRLDVALALAAKLPRLALDGFLTFFGSLRPLLIVKCHVWVRHVVMHHHTINGLDVPPTDNAVIAVIIGFTGSGTYPSQKSFSLISPSKDFAQLVVQGTGLLDTQVVEHHLCIPCAVDLRGWCLLRFAALERNDLLGLRGLLHFGKRFR